MEEKKVLNEEETEGVSGGRHYVKGDLDLSSKEAFAESLKKLPPLAGEMPKELPKELLDKVSGGSVFGGELDDWDMDYLDTCINDYKNNGTPLEDVLRYMAFCNLSNEAMFYVSTHW